MFHEVEKNTANADATKKHVVTFTSNFRTSRKPVAQNFISL